MFKSYKSAERRKLNWLPRKPRETRNRQSRDYKTRQKCKDRATQTPKMGGRFYLAPVVFFMVSILWFNLDTYSIKKLYFFTSDIQKH